MLKDDTREVLRAECYWHWQSDGGEALDCSFAPADGSAPWKLTLRNGAGRLEGATTIDVTSTRDRLFARGGEPVAVMHTKQGLAITLSLRRSISAAERDAVAATVAALEIGSL